MGGLIRKFHDTLRKTQFLPPDRMLAYQRGLLERLVRHAQAHVPFYRDSGRLDILFRSNGEIDWERWAEIPPLTRREVQQTPDALRSEYLAPEHGIVTRHQTSGTTGEPITVWRCNLAGEAVWTALLMRDFEHYGIDPHGRLVYFSSFDDGDEPQRHRFWYPAMAYLNLPGERIDMSDVQSASTLVDMTADLRPDYLRTHAVGIELLCAHDRNRRLADCNIKAVMTVGELLSGETRAFVEEHLGCEVVDFYSSTECGKIATSCPECGRYHVHAETIHVELIDENGREIAPCESGKVLATPLYNYAMPLIRYDHGDRARRGEPGRCSNQLPALDTIIGKERAAFVFSDGTAIRPGVPLKPIVEFLGAQAVQIAQTGPDRCEIRFVPGQIGREQMRFNAMTAYLRENWWGRLAVDYRMMDALPRTSPRAKLPIFVRDETFAGTTLHTGDERQDGLS